MRDYTDFMNMTPTELVAHALDCAKLGTLSTALVEALALQLDTAHGIALEVERLQEDLEDAEYRADSWREEAQAIQRQLDMVRG